MIHRLVLLLVLALFPLGLFLLWPKILQHFTTAELTVALVRQPHEEVLITGLVKSTGVAPFSIQALRIQEPGKEPYRRLVSLDADRAIELTLGKPVSGNYGASLLLPKPKTPNSQPEIWLATPLLTIDAGSASPSDAVQARQFDRPRLLASGGVSAAVWAVLLVWCITTWNARAGEGKESAKKTSSG